MFAENDLEECLQQIQLNVTTLTHSDALYLPDDDRASAKWEQRAGILNVASTAAFQPGPLMAVYFATKAYVLHFSEALANELQRNRRLRDLPVPWSNRQSSTSARKPPACAC
jgi:short-subunit dehydrogenase